MGMSDEDAATKEDLLLELRGKNTTRTIKEFSPAGIRLENNLEGEVKGIYNATYYATIDALVKPDGTIDYETRQIHTTDEGDTVLLDYKGKVFERAPLTTSSWARTPSRPRQRSSPG